MAEGKPTTAREALLAELLGDVQALLHKADAVGASVREAAELAQNAASALQSESARHRDGVDDMLKRTRVEFAAVLTTTMDASVSALASKQSKALEAAAVRAIAAAIDKEAQRQRDRTLARTVALASAIGAGVGVAVVLLVQFLTR